MPDFERTTSVEVGPDEAFRFLSDSSNLPRYVSHMALARPEGASRLHVAADVQGRHEDGHAQFRVDAAGRRLEWGTDSSSRYNGRIAVTPSGEGSKIALHLHVEHDDQGAEIERALDETVSNIERLLAGG